MAECYQTSLEFPSVKRRRVEADFNGVDITSNGGIPLLAQVDRQMGLTQAAAKVIGDSRRQASCEHYDLALQTATSRVETLASPSTLCRLEHRTVRQTAVAIHELLFEQFSKLRLFEQFSKLRQPCGSA